MTVYSLALCLDAPMQSWGIRSRGSIRDAGTEPSKSGVVGLLCAALGVPREDRDGIKELAQLRMGVRADREGILERDFHTVQNVPTTTGGGHRTTVGHRYYLADALFLVVVEGRDEARLSEIQRALLRPVWPIFLGRRAFPPARPLVTSGQNGEARTGLGLSDQPMERVLANHPWLEDRAEVRDTERGNSTRTPLRTVTDCDPADPAGQTRLDVPVSFGWSERQFRPRSVRVGHVPLTDDLITAKETSCI